MREKFKPSVSRKKRVELEKIKDRIHTKRKVSADARPPSKLEPVPRAFRVR